MNLRLVQTEDDANGHQSDANDQGILSVDGRGFCSARNVDPLANESAPTKLSGLPVIVSGSLWYWALSFVSRLRVLDPLQPKHLIVGVRHLVPPWKTSQESRYGSTETTEILIVNSGAT